MVATSRIAMAIDLNVHGNEQENQKQQQQQQNKKLEDKQFG